MTAMAVVRRFPGIGMGSGSFDLDAFFSDAGCSDDSSLAKGFGDANIIKAG